MSVAGTRMLLRGWVNSNFLAHMVAIFPDLVSTAAISYPHYQVDIQKFKKSFILSLQ